MKKTILLTAIAIAILVSCSKDEEKKDAKVPIVKTIAVHSLSTRSVECSGEIDSDNGFAIIEKGACWSTSPDPTINDQRTNEGSGAAAFSTFVEKKLEPGTKYYIRAYAKNSEGVGYGNNLTFRTFFELGQKFQGGVIIHIEDDVYDEGLIRGVVMAENDLPDTLGYLDAISACENLTLNGYSDWYLMDGFSVMFLDYFLQSQNMNLVNIKQRLYWVNDFNTAYYFYYDIDENRFFYYPEEPENLSWLMYVRPCRGYDLTEADLN